MTLLEALDKVLLAYGRYYDIEREAPMVPFVAEAVAHIHDQQYVLVKKAKVTESHSHEYVYFALEENLTEARAKELAQLAWEDGLSKTDPSPNHRTSDVTVMIIANTVEPEAKKAVKRTNNQISYAYGFRGYSNLRLLAFDLSTKTATTNRRGSDLKKIVGNI